MAIPKYVATSQKEEVYFYGTGDTPELALDDYVEGGEFEMWCADNLSEAGVNVSVDIWTAIDIDKSDWCEDERNPAWKWCLDKRVKSVTIKAK